MEFARFRFILKIRQDERGDIFKSPNLLIAFLIVFSLIFGIELGHLIVLVSNQFN